MLRHTNVINIYQQCVLKHVNTWVKVDLKRTYITYHLLFSCFRRIDNWAEGKRVVVPRPGRDPSRCRECEEWIEEEHPHQFYLRYVCQSLKEPDVFCNGCVLHTIMNNSNFQLLSEKWYSPSNISNNLGWWDFFQKTLPEFLTSNRPWK